MKNPFLQENTWVMSLVISADTYTGFNCWMDQQQPITGYLGPFEQFYAGLGVSPFDSATYDNSRRSCPGNIDGLLSPMGRGQQHQPQHPISLAADGLPTEQTPDRALGRENFRRGRYDPSPATESRGARDTNVRKCQRSPSGARQYAKTCPSCGRRAKNASDAA
jgi:hypothetical protein